MSRQVDIKALVSHIVRGDGGNRCRICMGDTTEGQVFLEDAVMVDGAKSLTLAELLETVTGAQVCAEMQLPGSVCSKCAEATILAHQFCTLVKNSISYWSETVTALQKLPTSVPDNSRAMYAVMQNGELQTWFTRTYTAGKKPRAIKLPKKLVSTRSANGSRCACPDCGKEYPSFHCLNLHLLNSSEKEVCRQCCKVFQRGKKLREHMFDAHNQILYMCDYCPRSFDSVVERYKHNIRAHQPGAHTCKFCWRTFRHAKGLDYHTWVHAAHVCNKCKRSFTNRGCYLHHRQTCDPNSKERNVLTWRERALNAEAPLERICDHCGKTFGSRRLIMYHMQRHHLNQRKHQCDWCGKRFITPAYLKEHLIVHTRERNFKCELCGAGLVSRTALVNHTRRHTGERPYPCMVCTERFISASMRTEHMKRKHGFGKQRQCRLCGAAILRRYEMRQHMLKVHHLTSIDEKEDWPFK